MALQFNGTTSKGTVALDLSAYAQLTVSVWLWWDSFGGSDHMAMEFTAANPGTAGAFYMDPDRFSGDFGIGMGFGATGWVDGFPRPSAAAWHHYLVTMNRATPVNKAWVDGVAQTLTTRDHSASAGATKFANSTLNIMNRNNGAFLFGAGRQAELALWGGVLLGLTHAKGLTAGANALTVHPDNLVHYEPMLENGADYGGGQHTATMTATTVVAHPPVRPGLIFPQPLSAYTEPAPPPGAPGPRLLLGVGV